MLGRFRPAEDRFFSLFEEAADILHQGSLLFKDMMEKHETMGERLCDLVTIEHRGDEITDQIIDKLNETFMTPFDREDIYSLARELDEILDSILSTVKIMDICFEIKNFESEGDRVYRAGVAGLFKNGADAIAVIKWKEVYEQLETAVDRCEKIAKLIRGVVVKYA